MKILVAEDDPHILEGVSSLLEKEGYLVLKASNGKTALDVFKRDKPDFLILDIMMPGMNGYDVCKEVRSQDARIPILFLSAKSEEIDRVLGLELGADDFISKPFGTRELLARIRTVSRRVLQVQAQKKPERAKSFCLGDLDVLPVELRAKRGETVMDLSPRDVAILELLATHKGQVVDRNDIFNAGWGVDFIGSTRALDQHISQLRKKIEIDPANPQIIKTVHGTGYRYE
jgi:DNA-binding response OmpR family regulator